MADLIAFESSWKKAAERKDKRQAQEEILAKAKIKYDKEEKRIEASKRKGEDTWMLPSLSDRIENEGQPVKKKKKDKKKKDKKTKKKKKRKKKESSSSSDSDSEECDAEPEWVEKGNDGAPKQRVLGPKLERDSWMLGPPDGGLLPVTSRQELRAEAKREQERKREEEEAMNQAGQHSRELNPFWKGGGQGLPTENPNKSTASKRKAIAGDSGVGWLRKAVQRCQEQAEERGVSVEEVAAERYGSWEDLQNRLRDAEENLMMAEHEKNQERYGNSSNRFAYGRNNRQDDRRNRDDNRRNGRDERSWSERKKKRSNSSSSDSSSYSDRDRNSKRRLIRDKNRDNRDSSNRDNNRDRPSDRSRYENKRRFKRPDEEVESHRDRSRDRRRSRSFDRDRSRDRNRKRSRDRDSSRDRYRDRSRDRNRSRERYRERSQDRDSRRNESQQRGLKSLAGKFKRPDRGSDSDQETVSRDRFSRDSTSHKDSSSRSSGWRKKGFMKPGEGHKNEEKYDREKKTEKKDSGVNKDADRKRRSSSHEKDRRDRLKKRDSHSESSSSGSESSSAESEKKSTTSLPPKPREEAQEKPAEETTVVILSEQEMNQLGAKIVRAEIMGNQALADKLKAKLDASRKVKEDAPKHVQQGAEAKSRDVGDNEVLLTRTDRSGMVRPVMADEDNAVPSRSIGKRRKLKKERTHAGSKGERERYFADDDKHDLKALVQQEKLGTAETHDEMFVRLAGKSADKATDDWQVDDMFVERAAKQNTDAMKEQRDRAMAIMEHKKMSSAMEKCTWCFDKIPKHLIIAIGIKTYLCLPPHKSLTAGHCMIVPMQHVTQATSIDEDVWDEIQIFRKGLTRMFADQGEDCIFMELCKNLSYHPHMFMECVPIPKETGDMAPLYFKKALLDSETEWAQNKKVVDLSEKGIRKSVPKGFPYFSVDFGLQGGYAHVIEDEQAFPKYFGREIVGGMLDAGPELWRKPHKENFDQQRQKVLQFAEWWKPYDWTHRLKSNKNDTDSSSDND